MTRTKVRRALLSVADKTDLVSFAERLLAAGVELIASDGTRAELTGSGVKAIPLSDLTGTSELLGGRVKTLHPVISAGILARRDDPSHLAELEGSGIEPIDLVVVGLYPFEQQDLQHDADLAELIDIGGVTLLRAAAKNHAWVGAVSSRAQYDQVADEIEAGGLTEQLRRRLAHSAFMRTARFDAVVADWLQDPVEGPPENLLLPLERFNALRYGENPHQEASLYRLGGSAAWWTQARQSQGKDLSFNNYLDADAAWWLVHSFAEPAAVIVKHTNPCGVAVRDTQVAAFTAAWECDSQAAFGGVVALNRPLETEAAAELADRFVEVLVVPELEAEPADALRAKRALRVLEAPAPHRERLEYRAITGGFLVQDPDQRESGSWKVAAGRVPSASELRDLEFAWTVAAHATSNAVVVAKDEAAVGIGAGDQSRVGAADRAIRQAATRSGGAVAASDGFVPFRDTVDLLAKAGVTALVEPGGSVRDEEVIEAADGHGVALLFTGRRHFRH